MIISQYKYLKYADRILYIENGNIYTDISEIRQKFPLDELIEIQQKEESRLMQSSLLMIPKANLDTREVMNRFLKKKVQEQVEVRETGKLDFKTVLAYITAMGVFSFIIFLIFNQSYMGTKVLIDFWLRD